MASEILHGALAVSGTALAGLGGRVCSVMVYVDTRRPFWSLKLVGGKFFGTMLLLGTAFVRRLGVDGLCRASWAMIAAHSLVCFAGWIFRDLES